jgi:hypothetical protein
MLWDRAWFGVIAAAILLVIRAVLAALFPKGYYFRVMLKFLVRDDREDESEGE